MMSDIASWGEVQAIAKSLGLLARLKAVGRELGNAWEPLWVPVPGCLETGSYGPVPEHQIEWIDLLAEVTTHRGRLVPPLVENKQAALTAALSQAGLVFEEQANWVRVLLPDDSLTQAPETLI